MRRFIKSNFSIREILNFNNYNAFPGVAIKILLLFLLKTKERQMFPYISINDKKFKLTSLAMQLIEKHKKAETFLEPFSIYQIDDNKLDFVSWEFYPQDVQNIVKKIRMRWTG